MPNGSVPDSEAQEIEYNFTYTLSSGTVTATLTPGTYLASFPGTSTTFTVDGLVTKGPITPDHMNIFFTTTTPGVQKRTYSAPGKPDYLTNYAVCHQSAVLLLTGP